ncbi:hypothetical protein VTH82DRAFT_4000 [Thermothelomyces myriococcoides]
MAQVATLSVRHRSWRDAPTLTAWTIQEEPSTRISWTPRSPVRPRRLRKPERRSLQAQAEEEFRDELLAAKIASVTKSVLAPTIASSRASSTSTTDSTNASSSPSRRLRRSRYSISSSLRPALTRLLPSTFSSPSSSRSTSRSTSPTPGSSSPPPPPPKPAVVRSNANISIPLQADLTIGCAELDIDKVARYLVPNNEDGNSSTSSNGGGLFSTRSQAAGVDVNARNHHGMTPLMAAVRSPFGPGPPPTPSCSSGGTAAPQRQQQQQRCRRPRAQQEMVRFLVEACGADVEAARVDRVTGAGETVLSMACAAGAPDVVRFLLTSGAQADRHLPCGRGIGTGGGNGSSGGGSGGVVGNGGKGAGSRAASTTSAAAAAAAAAVTTAPLLTGRGQTALHVAVLADRPECVEVLLREGGADPNAVFDAAGPDTNPSSGRGGLERRLTSLRGRGKGRGEGSREARKGEKAPKYPVSALHLAAHANPECARLLLEHGARVDIRDGQGRTPLHWAAEAGHEAVVRLLVAAGADLDAASHDGVTPLGAMTKVLERSPNGTRTHAGVFKFLLNLPRRGKA